MFVAVGTIIVDDIVTSDGRTLLGILGGAATHAAAGMRVWTRAVGLIGGVGGDFPAGHWEMLQRLGFDLRSVRRLPYTTPRAWQIYDAREHRTEIFRSPAQEFPHFLPTADQISTYADAHGFHLMTGDLDAVRSLCEAIHAVPGALVLWEPAPWQMVRTQQAPVLSLLRHIDIFSPNVEECAALLDRQDPVRWVDAFLEAGAAVVGIRMGRDGSLVRARSEATPRHVPAVSLGPPVDVTGAGNAYCGGFLVGYHRTGRSDLAGVHGAISAAITIQHLGVPMITEQIESEAQRLLAAHIP